MRMRIFLLVIIVAWIGTAASAMPRFSQKPSVSVSEGNVKIEFAAETQTDAAVDILNPEGKIIRHLAAGMLGPQAPAPFKPGLRQKLHWDRKDDAGRPVAGPCRVRVGLGLKAELDRILGWGGPLYGKITAMGINDRGMPHVFHLHQLTGKRHPLVPLSNKGSNRWIRHAYLSAFDRNGRYAGTSLPYRPDLKGADSHEFPVFTLDGVGRVPALIFRRFVHVAGVEIYPHKYRYKGTVYPSVYALPQSMAFSKKLGFLMVLDQEEDRCVAAIASDSTITPGPVLPGRSSAAHHLAVIPKKDSILVSDGTKIYRGQWKDKAMTPWLTGTFKTPTGIGTDAKGNIYIADKAAGKIVVLRSDGNTVRTHDVPEPTCLAVNPATGDLYVLSRGSEIVKLSGNGRTTARLTVPSSDETFLGLDPGSGPPILWISVSGGRIWKVLDKGTELVKVMTIGNRKDRLPPRITRIAAHPHRDEIYVKEWRWGDIYRRFKDRGNVLRVNGSTGKITRLPVKCQNDLYVGHDGHLYVFGYAGHNWAFIEKYDCNGKPIPVKDGMNGFKFESQSSRGNGDNSKGFTVAPNGDIYVLYHEHYDSTMGYGPHTGPMDKYGVEPKSYKKRPFTQPGPAWLSVFGPDGTMKKEKLISFTQGVSNVGVDRDGSIYVADAIKPADRIYPEAYDNAGELPRWKPDLREDAPKLPDEHWGWDSRPNWYLVNTGTLLKFGPEGGAVTWKHGRKSTAPPDFDGPVEYWRYCAGKASPVKVKGEKWAYFGVSPVPQGTGASFGFPRELYRKVGSKSHTYCCVCHNSRWSLDGHGRIVVPDAMRFAVTVLDSAGNKLLDFGGCTDLKARGHGNPVPQPPHPGIAFSYAPYLAVNDYGVYIVDTVNERIVKVKLGYHAAESCAVH